MRKWLVVILVILSAAVTSVGARAQNSILPTVIARGKLIVGTRSSAIGFSFKDAKGDLVGFDIDLGRALAEQLFHDPSKVEFVVLAGGPDRVPAIQSGRVDVVISSMSPYPERAQVIEFTVPYCISDTVFVVRASSSFQKNSDLNGKTVVSRQGADLEKMIADATKDVHFQGYPELSDAFLALRQGRGDAFFYERAATMYLLREYPTQFRVIDDPEHPINRSAISIGLKQGDQVFLNYLNWALYDLKANGKLQALHKKWFDSDALEPNWVRQPL